MTEEQTKTLNINVRETMFNLIIYGDIGPAKRIALLYDIDYDEFLEENYGDIVFAKLKET
jgi:hypothetical protein